MRELKLVGGFGSPYSCKMRAVLRYRRIPFRWIMRGSAWDVGIPPVPVALIPVLVLPGDNGAPDTAMIDSTFQILRLESMFPERSVVPPDPALALLQSLIEDYADEWLTKPMFHYRWKYAADIDKASHVLPLERDVNLDPDALERAARFFADRQISRLPVVGSNQTTTPVIEASYRRLLKLLDSHLAAGHPFLMGARPGAGDFGLFGQLFQLTHFDPTPAAIAAEQAPRVVAWVSWMEDLSWLDADDGGWIGRSEIGPTLRAFFFEIGRVYAPFLLANAGALQSNAKTVECEIDGQNWVQQPFPYQRRCLKWLREARAALGAQDRGFVDEVLEGTGCEALFNPRV
ncbi:MAG: glutathione S-transferase family protein [Candidatus Binataceae bacterium]